MLTDIKMPGMDGIELLRRLKQLNPDAEVIMISGHGDMELALKSLQYEALDFITKPIRDELLVNALKRATDKIVMRRQIKEHTESLERIVKEKSAKLVELVTPAGRGPGGGGALHCHARAGAILRGRAELFQRAALLHLHPQPLPGNCGRQPALQGPPGRHGGPQQLGGLFRAQRQRQRLPCVENDQ